MNPSADRLTDYTSQELLGMFRDWLGLPSSLTVPAGKELAPVDKILLMRLRTAYRAHLASCPDTRALPHYDIKDLIAGTRMGLDGMHIPLPGRCVRPLRVQLDCWHSPLADIQDKDSPAWHRQLYSYLRATPTEPQAFLIHDELVVCGFPEREPSVLPTVTMLDCVAVPADGSFRIDPAHLPELFIAA